MTTDDDRIVVISAAENRTNRVAQCDFRIEFHVTIGICSELARTIEYRLCVFLRCFVRLDDALGTSSRMSTRRRSWVAPTTKRPHDWRFASGTQLVLSTNPTASTGSSRTVTQCLVFTKTPIIRTSDPATSSSVAKAGLSIAIGGPFSIYIHLLCSMSDSSSYRQHSSRLASRMGSHFSRRGKIDRDLKIAPTTLLLMWSTRAEIRADSFDCSSRQELVTPTNTVDPEIVREIEPTRSLP